MSVGITAFFFRIFIPVGSEILGQQLGYYASYIFYFCVGVLAYRNKWLDEMQHISFRKWYALSAILIIVQPLILITSEALGVNESNYHGGLSAHSLAYALWEPLVGFGIIVLLLNLFRKRLNIENNLLTKAAGSSYTAYVIHAPILVAVSHISSYFTAPPILKFLSVGLITVTATYTTASIITNLPYKKKIL